MDTPTRPDDPRATSVRHILTRLQAGALSQDRAETELLALLDSSSPASSGISGLRSQD